MPNSKLFFKQDENSLKLFLDSPTEKVNAVAGEISLPTDFVLSQIQTGNSLINFWVEKPSLADGKIIFSGIIPGGYQGTNGLILNLTLSKIQGLSLKTQIQRESLKVSNAQVLLHDGLGTRVTVETPEIILEPFDTALAAAVPPRRHSRGGRDSRSL